MADHRAAAPDLHVPAHPVRFVTAAALFDGHDAAINIMRRILQRQGAEVVHLGHNRSVDEVVDAAVQEDAQGVAISSYQGGHVEYFSYLVELLRERGAGHVKVYGGGGGVIVPEEIALLRSRGVTIFSPEDGQRLGLAGMINTLVEACDVDLAAEPPAVEDVLSGSLPALARALTVLQDGRSPELAEALHAAAPDVPVLGITGTGGSGKSSLTDELLRRLRLDQEDKLRVAVIAVDPTRSRGGGALLGDRIRMNALDGDRVFFRSMATRGADGSLPERLADVIAVLRAAAFDLVIVETPGIGQGDAGHHLLRRPLAVRDDARSSAPPPSSRRSTCWTSRTPWRSTSSSAAAARTPAATSAASWSATGTPSARPGRTCRCSAPARPPSTTTASPRSTSTCARSCRRTGWRWPRAGCPAPTARPPPSTPPRCRHSAPATCPRSPRPCAGTTRPPPSTSPRPGGASTCAPRSRPCRPPGRLPARSPTCSTRPRRRCRRNRPRSLDTWPEVVQAYSGDEMVVHVRDRELRTELTRTTLSGNPVRRVALPRFTEHADLLRFLRAENLPGRFPFTAGVFAFKREGEDPARMFAGEGDAFRTNRRFHLLSEGGGATRLSTAFDSVTLYGRDPDPRPDVYGKVGHVGGVDRDAGRHARPVRRVRPVLADHRRCR
jgi:methylmalonyl-CoA mutase